MRRVTGSASVFEGLLIDWVVSTPVSPRLPVGLLSREQKAAELVRVQSEKAMRAAYEAELILGLADDTPELPADHPAAGKSSWAPDNELPGVDESFTAELALILNCGRRSASIQAVRAWTYRESLPATWAALAAGTLDEPRARALVDVLDTAAPAVARAVEARLLPEAVNLSIGKLRKRAVELLLELDAAAVDERRKAAERSADVRVYPAPREGMATLAADLPAPVAAECFDLVDQLAQMLKQDGDERPIGQLRAEVLADLIRRPWQTRPPVSARLHIFAPLGSLAGRSTEPGEVNGLPITAAALRELLAQLEFLGVQTPECGSVTVAITEENGTLRATVTLDQVQRLARRGCAEHPGGDCACPVLDRPPSTEAYEPTAAQRVFVKTRDRTCRFPNCGQRVAGPTWTTPSRTPAAARPPARTFAACAAPTTDSRPATRPGASPSATTACSPSPHPPASPEQPDHPACDHRALNHPAAARPSHRRSSPTRIHPPSDLRASAAVSGLPAQVRTHRGGQGRPSAA